MQKNQALKLIVKWGEKHDVVKFVVKFVVIRLLDCSVVVIPWWSENVFHIFELEIKICLMWSKIWLKSATCRCLDKIQFDRTLKMATKWEKWPLCAVYNVPLNSSAGCCFENWFSGRSVRHQCPSGPKIQPKNQNSCKSDWHKNGLTNFARTDAVQKLA